MAKENVSLNLILHQSLEKDSTSYNRNGHEPNGYNWKDKGRGNDMQQEF